MARATAGEQRTPWRPWGLWLGAGMVPHGRDYRIGERSQVICSSFAWSCILHMLCSNVPFSYVMLNLILCNVDQLGHRCWFKWAFRSWPSCPWVITEPRAKCTRSKINQELKDSSAYRALYGHFIPNFSCFSLPSEQIFDYCSQCPGFLRVLPETRAGACLFLRADPRKGISSAS